MSVMPKTLGIFRDGGITYTNGVVTTPLCCPSRASIFSGQYAHNHGVVSNTKSRALNQSHTMQAELKAHGYRTALSGKFLNGWTANPPHFDRWVMHLDSFIDPTFNWEGVQKKVPGYATTLLKRKAIEYLNHFEQQDTDPWFMQVSTNAPHEPATPATKYADAAIPAWNRSPAVLETDVSDKPAYVRAAKINRAEVAALRDRQLRSLMSVDDLVGTLFAKMRTLGEDRDTLAFFLSDNGLLLGEHRLIRKRLPYDQDIRVPFFVRWPDRFPAGVVENKVVANIDIAPTVYESAGITPSYEVDGESLLSSNRSRIFVEYFFDSAEGRSIPTWQQVWSPGETYTRYPATTPTTREYYGQDDTWQLTNLYQDGIEGNEPADAATFEALMDAWSACSGAEC